MSDDTTPEVTQPETTQPAADQAPSTTTPQPTGAPVESAPLPPAAPVSVRVHPTILAELEALLAELKAGVVGTPNELRNLAHKIHSHLFGA